MNDKPLTLPVSRSVRVQVRFEPSELSQLRERSRAEAGSLSATVRALALRSLDEQNAETAVYALAGVVAAEHVLSLLQTIVPEGQRRSALLVADAWSAALDRVGVARTELHGESER